MNVHTPLHRLRETPPGPREAPIAADPRLEPTPYADGPQPHGVTARGTGKKVVVAVAALAIIGLGGWLGTRYWPAVRDIEATDNAYLKADIINIAPQVAGQVAEVAVEDNQAVEAGAVLVRLDDRSLQAAVARAQADVFAAQAALANADERAKLQVSRIAASEADLQSSKAALDYAQADSERYQALSRTGAASMQRTQETRATFERASAAIVKSRADLTLEQQQVNVLSSERAQRAADLQRAQAALLSAQIDLSNTIVRAPRAGVVGNRGVRPGQYVKVGQTALNLVPVRDIYVVANFKETQLASMRAGMAATVKVDLLGGRVLEGRVESLAPASGAEFSVIPPDNATGNFTKIVQRIPVRIGVSVPDDLLGLLRPGSSVEARVDTASGAQGPHP